MKKLILPVLLMVILSSCKKDSGDPGVLKGTYQSSTVADVNPPVMFTQTGMTTNISIIKNYLIRNKITQDFRFDATTESIDAGIAIIDAKSNDDVKMKLTSKNANGPYSYNFTGRIKDKMTAEIILRSLKVDTTYLSTSNIDFSDIGKNPSSYTFVPLAPPSQYAGYLMSIKQYTLVVGNSNLYLPVLTYHISKVVGSANGFFSIANYGADATFDLLDPNVGNQLTAQDTIIIQQKFVKLIKQ
jgi:hypothetical protein